MSRARDIRVTSIPIELDKERTLKFDLNAFIELETIYGSVQAVLDRMQTGSIKAVRDILWAGLIHEDESLTPKAVGAMIDMSNLEELTSALTRAVEGALPSSDNKTEDRVELPNP